MVAECARVDTWRITRRGRSDLERTENIESTDPSLVNVVQWDDREPGEGPGDAYWPELDSAECCIKSALPYVSRDEKISFLYEAELERAQVLGMR